MKPINALVRFIARNNSTIVATCVVLMLLGCVATILSVLMEAKP